MGRVAVGAVVTAALALVGTAGVASAAPPPAAGQSYTLTVPARAIDEGPPKRPGYDTRVDLAAGQQVVLTATGTATCDVNDEQNARGAGCFQAGPNGTSETADSNFPGPGLSRYSLVGQVGDGPAFKVGAGPTTVSGVGRLRLGYNDSNFADNGGGFDVTITSPAPQPAKIMPTSGGGQTAAVGTPFPQPLVATVTDTAGKPSAGTTVTYTVTGGSASFPNGNTATATTDADGRATSPTLTAGTDAGPVTIQATVAGVTGAATFTENVTSVTVRGSVVFPSGGQNYSLAVNARTTGPNQAAGGLTVSGGDKNTTAQARTITSVSKTGPGTAVVTGTAVTSAGQTVTFRLTVTDGAGGRDQITLQLGSRTLSGTASSGDIVIG